VDNPTFKKDYEEYLKKLKKRKTNIQPIISEEITDLKAFDVDEISRISNNITLEKINKIQEKSGSSSQLASLINRFLFFKEIGYVEKLDLRKNLWLQLHELDELEIFLNIWTLYRIFIRDDASITAEWIEKLHLNWAIDIKNSISVNE
jgi:hypothetical protein